MMWVTYTGDAPTTWRGRAFEPGLAVAVEDADMIAKAAANPYFELAEGAPVADLEELREMAVSLGIKVDRRWGAERIQSEIDKALEG